MDSEGWHTLAEAAEKLNCSVDTIRRRLKRGEFQARQRNTNHGKVWLVSLGEVPNLERNLNGDAAQAAQVDAEVAAQDAQVAAQIETEHRQGLVELIRMVEKLQQENRALAEAATSWQVRADVLTMQLSQSQERVLALEAPKVVEEAPAGEPTRPWWKFWSI